MSWAFEYGCLTRRPLSCVGVLLWTRFYVLGLLGLRLALLFLFSSFPSCFFYCYSEHTHMDL